MLPGNSGDVLGRLAVELFVDEYGGLDAIVQYYQAFDGSPQTEWRNVFRDTFGLSI